MDFTLDVLASGRRFRTLKLVDEFTRGTRRGVCRVSRLGRRLYRTRRLRSASGAVMHEVFVSGCCTVDPSARIVRDEGGVTDARSYPRWT